ncbi:hypothetical protein V6N13_149131 [Hibiscus sabdariffa]
MGQSTGFSGKGQPEETQPVLEVPTDCSGDSGCQPVPGISEEEQPTQAVSDLQTEVRSHSHDSYQNEQSIDTHGNDQNELSVDAQLHGHPEQIIGSVASPTVSDQGESASTSLHPVEN